MPTVDDIKAHYAVLGDTARLFPTGQMLIVSHGFAITAAICCDKDIPIGRACTVVLDNVQSVWIEWQASA